jgi:uncharacterized secreted protein with C-terminal beta-propeller domain
MKSFTKPIAVVMIISFVVLASGCISENETADLKKFSSPNEIVSFIKENQITYAGIPLGYGATRTMAAAESQAFSADNSKAADYSTTNIQVEGVDEADIVKNDGKYIYLVSGQNITIVDAFPAADASIVSQIDVNGTPNEIYINGDKLVVFGSRSYYSESSGQGESGAEPGSAGVAVTEKIMAPDYMPYYYSWRAFVDVYDVSDRAEPVLERNIEFDGSYIDSRMIGDYVYVVMNQPLYIQDDVVTMPKIYTASAESDLFAYTDVYYFDVPDYSYQFTTIVSVNTQNDNEEPIVETYMMGYSNNIFVSLDNIYITYQKQMRNDVMFDQTLDEVILPLTPADIDTQITIIRNSGASSSEKMTQIGEIFQEYYNGLSSGEKEAFMQQMQDRMVDFQVKIQKELEKTVVHRIEVENGRIDYKSQGSVPGTILNQFSMDEYNDYFRIATTVGEVSRSGEATSLNNVYVLDMDLDVVGSLEDLAPGERIYSTRFIGDRAYLVTFKKVDPLFVIDLSDPANPSVLGKLKIPGYSDYLHPYDETHIIGIGKEATESEEGDFAWYQGVKMSLFDVSDVSDPKEVSKYVIGDRGTNSEALYDHKAFLFDKDKNLLVIPILLAEIDESDYPDGVPDNAYGDFVYQGAYVFSLSIEDGFALKGRVTHATEGFLKSGYYFYSPLSVKRSLYMDDVLYTISDGMIKMNSLENLEEINSLDLPFNDYYGYPIPL